MAQTMRLHHEPSGPLPIAVRRPPTQLQVKPDPSESPHGLTKELVGRDDGRGGTVVARDHERGIVCPRALREALLVDTLPGRVPKAIPATQALRAQRHRKHPRRFESEAAGSHTNMSSVLGSSPGTLKGVTP